GTYFVLLKDAPAAQKQAGWAFIKWMTDPEQTVSLSKATGYMPVRLSAINSPAMQSFYKDNPNYKVALDQLRNAQRFPFSPALFDIQREVIQPNLEAAVLGSKTSAEIMTTADQKANEIIGKYTGSGVAAGPEGRLAGVRAGRPLPGALRARLSVPG